MDDHLFAHLALLFKAVGLGALIALGITLLNILAFSFGTRGNILPGILFWFGAYWKLVLSVESFRRDQRSAEAKGGLILMVLIAPIAFLTALPLNGLLISLSIATAVALSPASPMAEMLG